MSRILLALSLSFLLLGVAAPPAEAQGRGGRGGGPPFCSSGAGHPVHGWGWCVAKGWAPAHYPARGYQAPYPVRGWVDAYWEDVPLRSKRAPRHGRPISRGELVEVVGPVAVRRIEGYGRDLGLRGAISAIWVDGGFPGTALELRIASVPVAYLHDPYGEGWAERVYLRPGTRPR